MASKLRLIGSLDCPFVQRVWIALEEAKVAYTWQEFSLRTPDLKPLGANKPKWFTDLNPNGSVPILLVDENPLFESNVLVNYVADAFAPQLYPKDLLEKYVNK